MTFDADKYVADVLAVARARVRAQSAAATAKAAAKAKPKAKTAEKIERVRTPPPLPPSVPQYEVTTLLTRSELMALERLAAQAGIEPAEYLRWGLQAMIETDECRQTILQTQ